MPGGCVCCDVISRSIISRLSTYVLWAPGEICNLFHTYLFTLAILCSLSCLSMSSRFADPTTMRTRSPIYPDDTLKRPPPSPSSNKAPPPKKLVPEDPCPAKTVLLDSHPESCTDKVSFSVSDAPRLALTIFQSRRAIASSSTRRCSHRYSSWTMATTRSFPERWSTSISNKRRQR